MRNPKFMLGLVLVAAACVGAAVWEPWEKSTAGAAVEYAALVKLPQQPSFPEAAMIPRQYEVWDSGVTARFEAGKAAARQRQWPAAVDALQRARALAANEQGWFLPSIEWHRDRASLLVLITLRLATVADARGNHAEAERLRNEADSLSAVAEEVSATVARFEKDVSWPTLKREWITHEDPVIRLLAIHAASIGAANDQPGYDRDEIVTALKEIASKDDFDKLRGWAKLYVQWLGDNQ